MDERAPVRAAGEIVGGRYRILRLIAHGGMASVYAAHDQALGREVALKLFPSQDADDAEQLRRFRMETRLVATLNHPGVVTLFDAGTDEGRHTGPAPYLTMELVEGQDLRSRLQQGTLDHAETAAVGAGIASALAYVHGRGVIHRDIKPANILLAHGEAGGLPMPKLTDFGIARLIENQTRLTSTGMMIGTAAYLSPEQVAGQQVTSASDIYSLGLVLLECLTGKAEFGGTAVEAAVARLHREPVIPPALGSQWRQLLGAMTAREPEARPAASTVHSSLQAALASPTYVPGPVAPAATQVLPAPPSRPPELRPTRPYLPLSVEDTREPTAVPPAVRRRRRPLLLAVLAFAAAVVVVAVGLLSSAPEAAQEPPPLPEIAGPLGDHLDQLQESVTP
jgi:serine/threonine protein kinase